MIHHVSSHVVLGFSPQNSFLNFNLNVNCMFDTNATNLYSADTIYSH